MRDQIMAALKDAMLDKDKTKVGTIRLMVAAIKNRDIETSDGISNAEIMTLLAKMNKQREDSATIYEGAGRLELAEQERAEITVINEFLPTQFSAEETDVIVAKVLLETNATTMRDMSKVMGALKSQYAGQIDFGLANKLIRAKLS